MMRAFDDNPTHKVISELMELFKEAAERFGQASDDRYLSVISLIQAFLQRQDVVAVLELQYDQHKQKRQIEASSSTSSNIRNSSSTVQEAGSVPASDTTINKENKGTGEEESDDEEEVDKHSSNRLNLIALGTQKPGNSRDGSSSSCINTHVLADESEGMRDCQRMAYSIDDGDEEEMDSPQMTLMTNSMDELEKELSSDLASMNNEFSSLLESFGKSSTEAGECNEQFSEEFSLKDFEELMSTYSLKEES